MTHMPTLQQPATGLAVGTTRTITTTLPLTGGGDLSVNRTFTVATFGTAAAGVVPASGGGTTNFMRADGSWAVPPGGISTVPYIDLSLAPYLVVAGNSTTAVAQANTNAINLAITTHSGTGAALVLPGGDIYIEQAPLGVQYSIWFGPGISKIDLSGQGPNETRLIQNGIGDGGDWHAILFDRCSSCGIHDLHIEQGTIKRPDGIQLNHLINVCNASLDATGTTRDIYGYNLSFGKTVGDQLRLFGDTAPIENIKFSNITMRGNGICIQAWAQSTVYVPGEWVRTAAGNQYICTVGGTSAASGTGPSGVVLATPYTDGSVTWNYKVAREGARTCISVQRGYRNVEIGNFYAIGAQNGVLDIEPTSAGGIYTGAEIMQYLSIHDGTIDNSLGKTAVAATFSGITAGAKSYGNRMSNIAIVAGGLSMIQTDQQMVLDCSISITAPLLNEPNFSNILIRQTNTDLMMRGLKVTRGGTAGAGVLIDTETGTRVTIADCELAQGTVGYPIYFEATTYPTVRSTRIHWTAATPSARSAIYIAAINADVLSPVVNDVTITTSSTKMLAAVELLSRTTLKFRNASITNIQAAGFVFTGVFMSIQGTPGDVNPIIQGCSFGPWPTWVAESEIASTIINTVFPIVAGSRGYDTARRLEGNVAPGAACIGNLGDYYTYRPTTTSASTFFKATQTAAGTPDNGGWVAK